MLKTKPQTKNTPNMSARWRKDKYVLCIHKLEIYTVMKKNESDIKWGQKASCRYDTAQCNLCQFGKGQNTEIGLANSKLY